MRDDTPVTLTGEIVSSLCNEKHLFRDATGKIMVRIDDEDWRGISVTPKPPWKVLVSGRRSSKAGRNRTMAGGAGPFLIPLQFFR